MLGDWFYTTGYDIFGREVKATKRSSPDNLTRWIITQSKSFTRKGIEKIREGLCLFSPYFSGPGKVKHSG